MDNDIDSACKSQGKMVTKKEEMRAAIREAIRLTKKEHIPVVIDCRVGPDDSVFPFVPPGASIADAFDESDLKKR